MSDLITDNRRHRLISGSGDEMVRLANSPSRVRLIPASVNHKPVLANLLELYIHDFCDILDLDLGPDGRFGYPHLDLYWTEPDRFPFLFTLDETPAGFALVQRLNPSTEGGTWDMAEFFVRRGLRRQGIGAQAADLVFRHCPGSWKVRVMDINTPALLFWNRVIHATANSAVCPALAHVEGKDWHIFSFSNLGDVQG